MHVVDEAHVEHAIGFIQNEDLHGAKVHGAASHVVHQAAGRGHDDIDAAVQGFELLLDVHAAVDGQRPHADEPAVVDDRPFDLHGQLPRGGQNQGPNRALVALGRPLVEDAT